MSMLSIIVKNVVTAFLTFFVLASCFAWYYQQDLLHHPTSYSMDEMKTKYLPSDLNIWPDSYNYMGLLAEPLDKSSVKGTVILYHGNAGSALDRAWYATEMTNLGYRVILHEYTGYGAKGGGVSEEEITRDALTAANQAKSRFTGKTFLVGESLGAAVAAKVANQIAVDGLLLITPWDSLKSVAKDLYWYLPSDLLLRETYDSVHQIQSYQGPLSVVIAEKDEVINPIFGHRLYESYKGSKKLWVAKGATHNSWNQIATQDFWKQVFDFLEGKEAEKKE